jgi:hypothetical protein
MGSGDIAPRILNVGTKQRWGATLTFRSFYCPGKATCYPFTVFTNWNLQISGLSTDECFSSVQILATPSPPPPLGPGLASTPSFRLPMGRRQSFPSGYLSETIVVVTDGSMHGNSKTHSRPARAVLCFLTKIFLYPISYPPTLGLISTLPIVVQTLMLFLSRMQALI